MASTNGLSRKDILVVLAITAVARLAYYVSGVHFDVSTLESYMQFIDTELLVTRLLESLFVLHILLRGDRNSRDQKDQSG